MKKGGLAFLLLFPFVVSFLGVATANGGFQKIERDLTGIEWDYPSQVGFKIQGERVKLEAKQVYDPTCALAYGNDLVWSLANVDPDDSEVHAVLEKSSKVNQDGNFDYYLLALTEGDVYLTVSNAKKTVSKTTMGIIYSDFAITIAPTVSPSQNNIDPNIYYGEFDYDSDYRKVKAEISYSFRVFPDNVAGAGASLTLVSQTPNLDVDLAGGKVKIKNVTEPKESASFVLSYNGKSRTCSFVLVKDAVNVYDYDGLLAATNRSEEGEIVCLRKSFERLDAFAEKDDKGNLVYENGSLKPKKDNVALFGHFGGYNRDGTPIYSFQDEVYAHPTTYDTSYIDQWNAFCEENPLYADSKLSKDVYAGLRVQKDFYGNGYTLSFHNLAYPYDVTPTNSKDEQGNIETVNIPTLSPSNLFRGPLFSYCLGDPYRFPLIALNGQDNAGIYVDGDGITLNDVTAYNASYGGSYSFLSYTGTVVDLHGDGITLKNCDLSAGKNIVRSFSCKNVLISNCLLSNALNFCLDLGSNSLDRIQEDKRSSFLDLQGNATTATYAEWISSAKGQETLMGYLGSLDGTTATPPEDLDRAEAAVDSLSKATERREWKRDYDGSATLKDTYLYKTGISCVGFESSFHGPFLYNASPSTISSLLSLVAGVEIDGAGHSIIPFIPKDLALQMKPSLLKVEGNTDFFDDKRIQDIVLEGILRQDLVGMIDLLLRTAGSISPEIQEQLDRLKEKLNIDAIFPLKDALAELASQGGYLNAHTDSKGETVSTLSMPFSYYGGGINDSMVDLSKWDNLLPYAGEAQEDLVHYYLHRGGSNTWNFLYRIVTMVTGFENFRFGFYDGSGSHVGLSPSREDLKNNATKGGVSL